MAGDSGDGGCDETRDHLYRKVAQKCDSICTIEEEFAFRELNVVAEFLRNLFQFAALA